MCTVSNSVYTYSSSRILSIFFLKVIQISTTVSFPPNLKLCILLLFFGGNDSGKNSILGGEGGGGIHFKSFEKTLVEAKLTVEIYIHMDGWMDGWRFYALFQIWTET